MLPAGRWCGWGWAQGDDSASRRERGLLFDLGGPSTLRGESADIERWTLPQVLSPGLGASAPQLLKNAGEIARALLVSEPGWDEPTPLAAAHCILKPPRTGATTPWHQDDAYGPPTALVRNPQFTLQICGCSARLTAVCCAGAPPSVVLGAPARCHSDHGVHALCARLTPLA